MNTINLNIPATLTECKTSKEIKVNNIFSINIPAEVKAELFEMGFHLGTNNDCIKQPLTNSQIKKAAELLSPYYGIISKYYTWYCSSIETYRIVFGK